MKLEWSVLDRKRKAGHLTQAIGSGFARPLDMTLRSSASQINLLTIGIVPSTVVYECTEVRYKVVG
jgi:hypothetical protein